MHIHTPIGIHPFKNTTAEWKTVSSYSIYAICLTHEETDAVHTPVSINSFSHLKYH